MIHLVRVQAQSLQLSSLRLFEVLKPLPLAAFPRHLIAHLRNDRALSARHLALKYPLTG